MHRRADHAYAAARMQARFGQLADDDDWQRLAVNRQLAPWIEQARLIPLKRWLSRLAVDARPHALERTLRAAWSAVVAETAAWLPEPERPAVAWLAALPYLAPLQAVRGEDTRPPRLAWIDEDPAIAAVAGEAAAPSRGKGPALAALVGGDAMALWRAEWRRRLAPVFPDARRQAEPLIVAVAVSDPADRAAKLAALRRGFRRHAGEPVAVFFFLGLLWLEFTRLRGEVMRRATLPEIVGRAAS